MRRSAHDSAESQEHDSFLDVVANIVGILILLVMVVGVRAAHAPLESDVANAKPPADTVAKNQIQPGADDVKELTGEINQLGNEVGRLVKLTADASNESRLRDAERVQLNALIISAQQSLDQRKSELSDSERSELQVTLDIAKARAHLDELMQEQMSLDVPGDEVEKVVNLPTPLAQTVRGDELHLRLKKGKVSVIPLDRLLGELRSHAKSNLWQLKGQSSISETLGPIGGYRLRYDLVERHLVVQSAAGPLNQGNVIRVEGWEVIPLAEDLGQDVDQALLPGSELSQVLAVRRPNTTTITVWTYSDSFADFRTLKKSLFDRGYATAGRPLPDGIRIGGSPRGTKSAAQ